MNLLDMIAADPSVDPALRELLAGDPCQRRARHELSPQQPRPHLLRVQWCSCPSCECCSLTGELRNQRGEHCRLAAQE